MGRLKTPLIFFVPDGNLTLLAEEFENLSRQRDTFCFIFHDVDMLPVTFSQVWSDPNLFLIIQIAHDNEIKFALDNISNMARLMLIY